MWNYKWWFHFIIHEKNISLNTLDESGLATCPALITFFFFFKFKCRNLGVSSYENLRHFSLFFGLSPTRLIYPMRISRQCWGWQRTSSTDCRGGSKTLSRRKSIFSRYCNRRYNRINCIFQLDFVCRVLFTCCTSFHYMFCLEKKEKKWFFYSTCHAIHFLFLIWF